jgi:hypothetical protein
MSRGLRARDAFLRDRAALPSRAAARAKVSAAPRGNRELACNIATTALAANRASPHRRTCPMPGLPWTTGQGGGKNARPAQGL